MLLHCMLDNLSVVGGMRVGMGIGSHGNKCTEQKEAQNKNTCNAMLHSWATFHAPKEVRKKKKTHNGGIYSMVYEVNLLKIRHKHSFFMPVHSRLTNMDGSPHPVKNTL